MWCYVFFHDPPSNRESYSSSLLYNFHEYIIQLYIIMGLTGISIVTYQNIYFFNTIYCSNGEVLYWTFIENRYHLAKCSHQQTQGYHQHIAVHSDRFGAVTLYGLSAIVFVKRTMLSMLFFLWNKLEIWGWVKSPCTPCNIKIAGIYPLVI